MTTERVVLLDDDGNPVGSELKSAVHSEHTPLHLAFSCHVLNPAGEVLVTRRSLHKQTWPGVWTNSFCGHPEPGEPSEEAVLRRAQDELGLSLRELRLELPHFRYRAVDASGLVENEVCPVFGASAVGPLRPDPAEVMDWQWAEPRAVREAVRATPFAFSPWQVRQVAESGIYAD